MASRSFNASGFKKACRAFERETVERLEGAVGSASHVLADAIARKAPVDTGRTRDSVELKPLRRSKGRIYQVVSVGEGRGSGHDVGAVEYGTFTSPAKPFFRPAVAESKPRMTRIVETSAKP